MQRIFKTALLTLLPVFGLVASNWQQPVERTDLRSSFSRTWQIADDVYQTKIYRTAVCQQSGAGEWILIQPGADVLDGPHVDLSAQNAVLTHTDNVQSSSSGFIWFNDSTDTYGSGSPAPLIGQNQNVYSDWWIMRGYMTLDLQSAINFLNNEYILTLINCNLNIPVDGTEGAGVSTISAKLRAGDISTIESTAWSQLASGTSIGSFDGTSTDNFLEINSESNYFSTLMSFIQNRIDNNREDMTLAFKSSNETFPDSTLIYTQLSDGSGNNEVLSITYTAQRRHLQLANKMVGTDYNLYYTTLEIRHETDNWQTVDSGDSIEVTRGHEYTEHPTNQQNSGPETLAQHRYWKNEDDDLLTYNLERQFTMGNQHEEDAMFKYVYTTQFEDEPGVGGLVQLSDPWRKLSGSWNQSSAYFTPAGGDWDVFNGESDTERSYRVKVINTLVYNSSQSWKWQRWAVYNHDYIEDTVGNIAELLGANNPEECQVIFNNADNAIIRSNYTHDYPVQFQVPAGISYSIYDPWHYNQGSGTFSAATVPVTGDSFRVFLNETQPKYKLIVPNTTYANGTFSNFTGFTCDSASFGAINLDSQGFATQEAVFSGSGAPLVAHYEEIESGDIVTVTSSLADIPANSVVEMPLNSEIQLYSTAPMQGTQNQPITFKSDGSGNWKGIKVKAGDLTIENLKIQHADNAVLLDLDNYDLCKLKNLTVDSCTVGISTMIDNFTYIPLDLSIQNSRFTNISNAAIAAQTVDLGNVRVINCKFSLPSDNTATAIRFSIPWDPVWGGQNYHAEFDSLQIIDNQIEDFNTGVTLHFKASNNDLNWTQNPIEWVIVKQNEIARCDTGINSSGDVLLFSHHNVMDSCRVGYVLDYPDPDNFHSCTEIRYRIMNETIIGNGNSVGILDLNPEPTRPYSTLTAFIGSSIFAYHDTAAYNPYTAVYQDNLLYANNYNFPYSFVGYYDCWSSGNNYVTGNPYFADASNGDYRLTSASTLAIDSGYVDFDGDGVAYPNDPDDVDPDSTRMDIGAFYFDKTPSAPSLSLTASNGQHPQLSWTIPDKDIHHYTIYKRYYVSKFNQSTSYVYNYTSQAYSDPGFVCSGNGGATAYYKVRATDNVVQTSNWSNQKSTSGIVGMSKFAGVPDKFALKSAYPNPFNPSTKLDYALPVSANVDVRIYNMLGSLVYQEIAVNQPAGWYSLIWDGKDIRNNQVPSGVYLISITARGTDSREGYDGTMNFSQVQKVILLK